MQIVDIPIPHSAATLESQHMTVASYLRSALESIELGEFHRALAALNRAIIDADDAQLGESYGLRGFVRLRLEQFEHAEDDCTQSIKRRGNDPETLAWRAAARAELGRWRLAFEDLDAARNASPDSASTFVQQMHVFLPPAMEWFQTQIQNDNATADLFFDRGWIYLLTDELGKAQRDFHQAIEHDDTHGGARVGLAKVALKQLDHESAIRYASQALQLDDRVLHLALSCRAQAYAANGQLSQAIEDVNRLREKVGDTQEGLILCATLRKQLGDFAGAIEDLNLAERLKSTLAVILAKRAEVYTEMRNYEMALSDYQDYLKRVPSDERIWLRRGQIHLQQGQLDEARNCFDRALEIDDICAAAYLGRCQVYMSMSNHAQALIESEKVLRLDSRNLDTYVARGKIFHDQKRFKQAEADFEKAAELTQDRRKLAEILYLRGVTRYEMGQAHSAIDDFKRASQLRPMHAGTHIWRAATSAKLEDWPDVIEHLQHAISLRPSAAQQYRKLGKPVAQKAIEFFNKMIRIGPATPELFRHRGRAYQFLGRTDEAIADMTVSLNSKNQDSKTMIQRAQLYVKQGDFAAAISDLSKVIKLQSDHHLAYYNRARAFHESGNDENAMRDVSRAIEIDPGQSRYHVLRGDLRLLAHDIDAAIEDYSQATVLDADDHLAFRKRGSCYLKKNQYLHAIADLTRSVELFPSLPETHVLRGQAYLKNDQLELAKEDFEIAVTIDVTQVRAFCGLGQCMAQMQKHEAGLIWLTKSLHRFEDQRDLAELLMTRGKVFYQMGRFPPALSDFSMVIELQREDPKAVAAARCARAVVLVQHGELIRAKQEFDRVLAKFPDHPIAKSAAHWLADGQGTRPAILQPPDKLIRPTRPPVVSDPLEFESTDPKWDASPPFDLWIVRTERRREYGPVAKNILDDWVRQGRVIAAARLLRAGWPKWRKATSVYKQLKNRS